MEIIPSKRLTLQTAEGVVFSFIVASPAIRFCAWAVDMMIVIGLSIATGTALRFASPILGELATAIQIVMTFIYSIGYFVVLEWYMRGQTIGKRLLRLRVMDARGLRLHLSQVVMRNLLRPVDMLPAFFLLGGLAAFFSRRGQRLGDMAANTIVAYHPEIQQPDLANVVGDKFNSLRQYPHLAARLRQRTSPEQAALVLETLMRWNDLDPDTRIEVVGDIAEYFRELIHFPEEATAGLPDDQYLRNIVDILYQ
jgi:uncharacterized RDD family membrane protein YckC